MKIGILKKIIWKWKFGKLNLKIGNYSKMEVLKIRFGNLNFEKIFENEIFENWNFEKIIWRLKFWN